MSAALPSGRCARTLLLFGAVGFLAGFLGPIVLNPEANQGPLLGIFITGPLGFVFGLGWGVFRESQRALREKNDQAKR